MSDIKTFVKNVVREVIKTEYPHARRPGIVRAKIKSSVQTGSGRNKYTLKILDLNGNEERDAPEIPEIFSNAEYHQGEIVVVGYVNGILPCILGRWVSETCWDE